MKVEFMLSKKKQQTNKINKHTKTCNTRAFSRFGGFPEEFYLDGNLADHFKISYRTSYLRVRSRCESNFIGGHVKFQEQVKTLSTWIFKKQK